MSKLYFNAAGPDLIDQGIEEVVDAIARIKGGVDEVDADGPEGVLLTVRILVPKTEMEDDFAWFSLGPILEADANPGVPLPFAIMRGRRHRISEGKEAGHRATFSFQAIDQKAVLVVEHLLEPLTGDIALRVAVDCVADAHVVGGNTLRHRTRGSARLEEVPDHFLPSPDLGKGPVGRPVEIDGQRLAGSSGAGRGSGL